MAKILGEEKKEGKLYRLIEMRDAMLNSVDNAKNVKDEQELLIKVIKNSDEKDRFEQFTNELSGQVSQLQSQIETLTSRVEKLDEIIDKCQKDETAKELIDTFIDAIGMFNSFGNE